MDNSYAAMDIDALRKRCAALEQQNAELAARIQWFMEQFKLTKLRQFGPSSERTAPAEQPSLFNEAESEATIGDAASETITYKRRKEKGRREAQLANLPVEIVEHTLPEDELVCPKCQ